MSETQKQYAPGEHPDLPPPPLTTGPIAWVRDNLFGSISNIVLSVVAIYLLSLLIPALYSWFYGDAVFEAASRRECKTIGQGACWAFIGERINQFTYGFYPVDERWRVQLSLALLFVAVFPVLYDKAPARGKMIVFSVAYPFIAAVLLLGGTYDLSFGLSDLFEGTWYAGWLAAILSPLMSVNSGLEPVETTRFGGFMLTMVIGVTGIAASLPIGVVLALGRRSEMPAVRIVCVLFIEFIRGVPLITLLFVASTMLTYFLPPGSTFDLLARVLIMVTLFSAAYIAEVVRGGLQAIPSGQLEAANALGLRYWQAMRLIILPQALKISIPGIVNTFIGLFKDTTLVIIIGLLDPLGIGQSALADAKWNGLSTEVYVFVAVFFWIFCFSMSRYSLYLENKLHTGHKR